jgi:hypothetical protein
MSLQNYLLCRHVQTLTRSLIYKILDSISVLKITKQFTSFFLSLSFDGLNYSLFYNIISLLNYSIIQYMDHPHIQSSQSFEEQLGKSSSFLSVNIYFKHVLVWWLFCIQNKCVPDVTKACMWLIIFMCLKYLFTWCNIRLFEISVCNEVTVGWEESMWVLSDTF